MKKAGLIGGLGPASTLDYYREIIEGCMKKTGDGNYPEIIINSINMTEIMSDIADDHWNKVADRLVKSVKELAGGGAEFAAIASNTPHIVFDRVSERSPIPLISIVQETCAKIIQMRVKKPLIIGTLFTMREKLYSGVLERQGINPVEITDEEQEIIYSLFYPNLENGVLIEEDKRRMLALVNGIICERSADSLVLACTELPLMIKPEDIKMPVIDTMRVHIDAIIEHMTNK